MKTEKFFLFDLDETLVTGDLIKVASQQLLENGQIDRVYTNFDVQDYDLTGLPNQLKTRVLDLFNDPLFAAEPKYIIESVYSFIYSIQAMGCRLGILTCRPRHLRVATLTNLGREFPGIIWDEGVHFSSNASKLELLKQLMPDYFFDDRLEFCNESAQLGIKTYLITNKYCPWNTNKPTHKDVVRLKCVSKFDIRQLIGGSYANGPKTP